MAIIDWIVLCGTLLFIVLYGTWKTKGSATVKDYIGGGKEAKWWTVGLSVMATQASAITFLSTPGQAFHSGMGFVQFYLGMPIAIIIICIVFIPLYHKTKVYTAYEYLESRFDLKTRTLTASFFLIQRIFLNIAIGLLVILYTVSGGTKAVNFTQKYQMAIIFSGMFIAFFLILDYLPENISFFKALEIAGANGKMDVLNFSFNLNDRYTVWTGVLGGTFLFLSYFGTDQSQVQRYLSGKSLRESQMGLLFNGFLKAPMQFFILLVGVMVFVFYQFNEAPLNFNPAAKEAIVASSFNKEYEELEDQLKELQTQKTRTIQESVSNNTLLNKNAKNALKKINTRIKKTREKAKLIVKKANSMVETNDKDYVFIHFVINNLPRGLIGLLLAVILSAAMSSTASELNALASTTTIDLYKRNHKEKKDDQHYVKATKMFTLLWGTLAIFVACFANLFDNLIQLVNIIGSIFYGNVLGIFLLAFFIKFVTSNATFIAAICTQIIIIVVWYLDLLPFLWLNALGCILVMSLASLFTKINFRLS